MMKVVVDYGIDLGVGVEREPNSYADQDPTDGIARLTPCDHDSRQAKRQQTEDAYASGPSGAEVIGLGQGKVKENKREPKNPEDDRRRRRGHAEVAPGDRRC